MGDFFDLTVEGRQVQATDENRISTVTITDVSRTKLIQQLLADLDSREMILESLESEELSAIFGGQIKDFIDFAGRTGMFTHEARCDLIEYAGLRAPIMRNALMEIQRARDEILPSLGCDFHLLRKADYERLEDLGEEEVIKVYEDQFRAYTARRAELGTWPWCVMHKPEVVSNQDYCGNCPFKKTHGNCHSPDSDVICQNVLFGYVRNMAQMLQKDSRWRGVHRLVSWPPFMEQVNRIYKTTQELLGEPI